MLKVINGFGFCYDSIEEYIDREKLIKEAYGNFEMSNKDMVKNLLSFNTILDYRINKDNKMYILIPNIPCWEMDHGHYSLIKDKEKAKEYIWYQLFNIFNENLSREEFYKMLFDIEDIYYEF